MKKLFLPYDHEYWDSLSTNQWCNYLNHEDRHAEWYRKNVNEDTGANSVKHWCSRFEPEVREIAKEKLAELEANESNLARYKQILHEWNPVSAREWEGYLYLLLAADECKTQVNIESIRIRSLARRLGLISTVKYQNTGFSAQVERAREIKAEEIFDGTLKRAGSTKVGLCPFHDEKSGSFTIYPDGHWYCYGCLVHGKDAISYVMQLRHVDFKAAVTELTGGQR